MKDTNEKRFKLTTAEAVAFIRRQPARTRFNLSVRIDAPLVDSEDEYFRDACASYMPLTRPDAIRLVGSILTDTLEGRGGRIPVRTYDSTIAGETRNVVWIG